MRSIQSSGISSGDSPEKTTQLSASSGEPAPNREAITAAYRRISKDVADCSAGSQRVANAVSLLAVSKTRTAAEVDAAYSAGARQFGENYLQDALPKLQALTHHTDIVWHFIGAVQSNKTTEIATHFNWVHTVDRSKIARRLNSARAQLNVADRSALNICLQVNLHDESQKAGCTPEQLPELVDSIAQLPQLALRGLMILPAVDVEPARAFADTAALFEQLATQTTTDLPQWDTLSMGMSGDYPAAIAAGSTIVRVGTALFGPRATR